MPDLFLIGLTGRAGAGKDTCAEILAHYGFHALAFADALREEVTEAFSVPRWVFVQRAAKETDRPALAIRNCINPAFRDRMVELGHGLDEDRSPRWIMQRWGTEFRRAQNPLYWIFALDFRVRMAYRNGQRRLVVTDVRFDNEAECVRGLLGRVLQVHRPELRALQPDSATHSSEPVTPLPADDVIHNDGDREHLHAEVVRVVSRFGSLAHGPALGARS